VFLPSRTDVDLLVPKSRQYPGAMEFFAGEAISESGAGQPGRPSWAELWRFVREGYGDWYRRTIAAGGGGGQTV